MFDAPYLVVVGVTARLADGYFVGNEAKIHFGEAAIEVMHADSVHVNGHAVDICVRKRGEWRENALPTCLNFIEQKLLVARNE